MKRGTFRVSDYEKFSGLTELELLYEIEDKAFGIERPAEKLTKDPDIPATSRISKKVRASLTDIEILCEIIKDKIRSREGSKRRVSKTYIERAIEMDMEREKKSIQYEEQRLESARKAREAKNRKNGKKEKG